MSSPHPGPASVTVRYFAGARAASGVDTEERGSAPAERWLVDGGPATVGVIASVTRSFCGACDRTRLTADGQIRNCLFAREESDLRSAMRDGVAWRDESLLAVGATVDVLPPFAGG